MFFFFKKFTFLNSYLKFKISSKKFKYSSIKLYFKFLREINKKSSFIFNKNTQTMPHLSNSIKFYKSFSYNKKYKQISILNSSNNKSATNLKKFNHILYNFGFRFKYLVSNNFLSYLRSLSYNNGTKKFKSIFRKNQKRFFFYNKKLKLNLLNLKYTYLKRLFFLFRKNRVNLLYLKNKNINFAYSTDSFFYKNKLSIFSNSYNPYLYKSNSILKTKLKFSPKAK